MCGGRLVLQRPTPSHGHHHNITTITTAEYQQRPTQQHMKPARHKGSSIRRERRPMSTRVGNAAAVLAAAWSVPLRCCQALRLTCSATGYQYRGVSMRITTQQGRMAARLAGGFVPRGGGTQRAIGGVAGARSSGLGRGGDFVGGSLAVLSGSGRRRAVAAASGGSVRMVSDESQFFSDPDAPAVVEGLGPPGPLEGGDQVSPTCSQPASQPLST